MGGMTENNLRKFLDNDDPALVMLGISMFMGETSDDYLGFIIGLNMFHSDKTVRAKAKSVFIKRAPNPLKLSLKNMWKPSYRNIKDQDRTAHIFKNILEKLHNYQLNLVDICYTATKRDTYVIAALENFRPKEAYLDLAIPLLGSDDIGATRSWLIQDSAINFILRMGDMAVPKINELLKSEDTTIATNSAKILQEIGSSKSVIPLVEALKNVNKLDRRDGNSDEDKWKDAYLIEQCIDALGKIGDKKTIDTIKEFITNKNAKRGASVRLSAAEAIEKMGWVPETNEEKIDFLIAKKDWSAISDLGEEAVIKLITLLDDDSDFTKNDAIQCLGNIGHKKAVEPIIEVVKGDETDYNERKFIEHGIEALGKIGDKKAFEVLHQKLNKNKDLNYSTKRTWLVAINAIGSLNDERTFDLIASKFEEATKMDPNRVLPDIINAWSHCADIRLVKPIIEWLRDEGNKIDDLRTLEATGEALGNVGKPALNEILELLQSGRLNRKVSLIALEKIEYKPDDLMQFYIMTKLDVSKARFRGAHLKDFALEVEKNILDSIEIGKIEPLCAILKEVTEDDTSSSKDWYYQKVAETLARIGNKEAIKSLKKAGFEAHAKWISGDVQGLVEIIDSDEDDEASLIHRKNAALALGFIADDEVIESLMNVLHRDSPRNRHYGRIIGSAIEKIRDRQDNREGNIEELLQSNDNAKILIGLEKAEEGILSEEGFFGEINLQNFHQRQEIILGIKLWNEEPEIRNKAAAILNSSDLIEKTKKLNNVWKLKTLKSIGNYCVKLKNLGIERAMPVNRLIAFAQKNDKNEALRLLAKYGNSTAVIPLMSELAAGNADSRFKIAIVLGEIGDPRAINILIESLKGRYDDNMTYYRGRINSETARAAAARALGTFGDSRATQALIESGLQNAKEASKDDLVVGYSAEALGLIGDKIAVEPLLNILDNYEEIDTIKDDLTVNRRWDGSDSTVSEKAIEALVKIGDKRAVDSLLNMLEYGHPSGSEETKKASANMPEKRETYWPSGDQKVTLSWALENLGWVPDTEKRRALKLLNKCGNTHAMGNIDATELTLEEFTKWGSSAINPLCQLLVHPHHLVCINAVKMLKKMGDTNAIESLVEVTKTTENHVLQTAAMEAIAKIDKSTLYEFLEEETPACKEAIRLIGEIHSESANTDRIEIPDKIIEKLIKFINSYDKNIREIAIQTIGTLESTKAVEPLIELVENALRDENSSAILFNWDHDNHSSYRNAISALGNIGDKKALDILLKAKKHQEGRGYRDIEFALEKLGHEGKD